MPLTGTHLNIQISSRRWYHIHFTSEKSATIYRYNPTKDTINGMGGPIFNCKTNHLSDGWFLFLVKDHSTTKRIWPEIKIRLDEMTITKQYPEDRLASLLDGTAIS